MKKLIALVLLLALLLALPGCGKAGGGYRIIDTLDKEEFSVAFRDGDMLCEYVSAAMQVLAANGSMHKVALAWFAKDETTLEGDSAALDQYTGSIPSRQLIVGVDVASFPMAYTDGNGGFFGFDVDMMTEVCRLLGWDIRFIAIDEDDAATELASGNIDCACGGIGFAESSKWSLTPTYLENRLVLVTSRDSGIKKTANLKNKVVAIGYSSKEAAALDSIGRVREKLEKIVLADGNDLCFKYLEVDFCDVALVDSVAADYYMK